MRIVSATRVPTAMSAATLLLLAAAGGACERQPQNAPPPASPITETTPAAAPARPTYTVRAEFVDFMPPRDGRPREAKLHHERIPDFKNHLGKVIGDGQGMKPMTMAFNQGPGVDFSPLKRGDKIEFTLEVDWSQQATQRALIVTRYSLLPADTVLSFEDVPAPAPGTPAAPAESPAGR